MKTKVIVFLLVGIMLFSGCKSGKEKETVTTAPPETTKNEETVKGDLNIAQSESTDDRYVFNGERPIAVMVDNDDDNARPHAGLDEAYLIYEMMIEGGSTRFMALFRGVDTQKIGPVRSSRHYYLDYVLENDAIYTHYGWSPKAMSDISAFGINKINGILGNDDSAFWRERKYKGDWHSAYTSIQNIKDMAAGKGYKTQTERTNAIKYSDASVCLDEENAAKEVVLKYSQKYTTGYIYNNEKGVYEKTINNKPHLMQSGDVLEVKNIIIELIYDTALGDGSDRRNINTTGSGKGYYITNGAYESITWEKPSRKENTVYKRQDGTELLINKGNTIVNVISPAAAITME